MRTLGDLWHRNVRLNPDQPALFYEDQLWTHGQIARRGRRLASALYGLGVRKQDRVALLSMNRPEWYEYYAACHMAGFIAATVNFRLAAPEILWIVKDGGAKVLIFEEQYAAAVDSIRSQLPSVEHYVCLGTAPEWARSYDEVFATGDDTQGAPTRPDPLDIAHLIYTSGTTGRPKGVARSHAAELAVGRGLANVMAMPADVRMLLMMPLFHIGALAESLAAFSTGGAVVLQRAFAPVEVLKAIEREKVTMVHLAPTMVQQVLDHPEIGEHDLSSLEVVCYSAAPMPATVLRRGIELLGNIFMNQYGGTESGLGTVLHLHRHVLKGPESEVRRLPSVGQPFPDVEVRILDAEDRDCAVGVAGEICVRSPALMSYYWNNSIATAEALTDGWLRTGDMGYLDDQEFLFLVDRKKDMIISGGENIYCREVEEALMEHGSLVDVAVIGVPDERWGEAVKAIAVRKPDAASVTEAELVEFAGTRIARYKRPKSIVFVDELPRLPSGKISKVRLRELYRS
jgi:acyl-CoA synthetase (AMP-forming)/AMP-acid ligase II